MRHLIISADDYGYSPAYDEGILEAAEAKAIDAASVLVRRGPVRARELLLAGVEVGLHLEFDSPVSGAVAGGVDRSSAQASLVLQLDRFGEAFGRPPAFLDGHHHCHAQAGLAGVVGRMAAERGLPVRSVDAAHRRLLRRLGDRYRRPAGRPRERGRAGDAAGPGGDAGGRSRLPTGSSSGWCTPATRTRRPARRTTPGASRTCGCWWTYSMPARC